MSMMSKQEEILYVLLEEIIHEMVVITMIVIEYMNRKRGRKRRRGSSFSYIERIPTQFRELTRLVGGNDLDCLHNLRMDRRTFARLCYILKNVGGLVDGKFVTVEEQVAMFLSVLAHHKKNRVVRYNFMRSGQTVSHYIHVVLTSILSLHSVLLVKPTPVPEDCTNTRWKWFKGCLGALDGTYINVHVPITDKGRFRTRKGQISTNVLAACDRDMQFAYVLPGWEGSAADARVLRDSLNRVNGLKVPTGNYYLCDNGYANSPGFLTPFRCVRYHLSEWGPTSDRPNTYQEHFNMRHTRARNVIERAFGVMKMRWGILRSATFYPIKTQIRMIMACFLLHNYIRREMPVDPFEERLDTDDFHDDEDTHENVEFITGTEATSEWSNYRENLAQTIWEEYNIGS